jgi:hypothetical protein
MKKGQRKPNAKKRSVYQRKYNLTEEQTERRSSRNKARRKMSKKVGKSALRGKDVHHKDGNPKNNSRKNLRVSSVRKNRSNNKRR